MKKIITLLLVLLSVQLKAQDTIEVYPSIWWVGMKNPNLQVMLRGKEIGKASGFNVSYPGVTLKKVTKVKNSNYVFLDLLVSPAAKPGKIDINFNGFVEGKINLSF